MERQPRISDARRACPVGVPGRRPQHILLYEYKQDLQRSPLSWWVNAPSLSVLVQPPTLVPAAIYDLEQKRQHKPSALHLCVTPDTSILTERG